jgi:Na+/proline symporter
MKGLMEANAVPIHYHHAWLVWALYFVGAALHILLQVFDIAAKNKWKPKAVLMAIGPAVAFRAFAASMAFGLIWYYPEGIANVLKLVGVNIGADEAEVLAFPMNNFIAGLYGLGLDSALGYIPGLKSWLPSVTDTTSVTAPK